MRVFVAILVVVGLLVPMSAAVADHHSRILQLWKCKLNEGKTYDDVHAANGKWVKFVNAQVGGEVEIVSYIETPITGKTEGFQYADVFPSIEAWNAMRQAMETEEGKAIGDELDEVADCSYNSLYETKKTMAAE
jgi:hypothetical protein